VKEIQDIFIFKKIRFRTISILAIFLIISLGSTLIDGSRVSGLITEEDTNKTLEDGLLNTILDKMDVLFEVNETSRSLEYKGDTVTILEALLGLESINRTAELNVSYKEAILDYIMERRTCWTSNGTNEGQEHERLNWWGGLTESIQSAKILKILGSLKKEVIDDLLHIIDYKYKRSVSWNLGGKTFKELYEIVVVAYEYGLFDILDHWGISVLTPELAQEIRSTELKPLYEYGKILDRTKTNFSLHPSSVKTIQAKSGERIKNALITLDDWFNNSLAIPVPFIELKLQWDERNIPNNEQKELAQSIGLVQIIEKNGTKELYAEDSKYKTNIDLLEVNDGSNYYYYSYEDWNKELLWYKMYLELYDGKGNLSRTVRLDPFKGMGEINLNDHTFKDYSVVLRLKQALHTFDFSWDNIQYYIQLEGWKNETNINFELDGLSINLNLADKTITVKELTTDLIVNGTTIQLNDSSGLAKTPTKLAYTQNLTEDDVQLVKGKDGKIHTFSYIDPYPEYVIDYNITQEIDCVVYGKIDKNMSKGHLYIDSSSPYLAQGASIYSWPIGSDFTDAWSKDEYIFGMSYGNQLFTNIEAEDSYHVLIYPATNNETQKLVNTEKTIDIGVEVVIQDIIRNDHPASKIAYYVPLFNLSLNSFNEIENTSIIENNMIDIMKYTEVLTRVIDVPAPNVVDTYKLLCSLYAYQNTSTLLFKDSITTTYKIWHILAKLGYFDTLVSIKEVRSVYKRIMKDYYHESLKTVGNQIVLDKCSFSEYKGGEVTTFRSIKNAIKLLKLIKYKLSTGTIIGGKGMVINPDYKNYPLDLKVSEIEGKGYLYEMSKVNSKTRLLELQLETYQSIQSTLQENYEINLQEITGIKQINIRQESTLLSKDMLFWKSEQEANQPVINHEFVAITVLLLTGLVVCTDIGGKSRHKLVNLMLVLMILVQVYAMPNISSRFIKGLGEQLELISKLTRFLEDKIYEFSRKAIAVEHRKYKRPIMNISLANVNYYATEQLKVEIKDHSVKAGYNNYKQEVSQIKSRITELNHQPSQTTNIARLPVRLNYRDFVYNEYIKLLSEEVARRVDKQKERDEYLSKTKNNIGSTLKSAGNTIGNLAKNAAVTTLKLATPPVAVQALAALKMILIDGLPDKNDLDDVNIKAAKYFGLGKYGIFQKILNENNVQGKILRGMSSFDAARVLDDAAKDVGGKIGAEGRLTDLRMDPTYAARIRIASQIPDATNRRVALVSLGADAVSNLIGQKVTTITSKTLNKGISKAISTKLKARTGNSEGMVYVGSELDGRVIIAIVLPKNTRADDFLNEIKLGGMLNVLDEKVEEDALKAMFTNVNLSGSGLDALIKKDTIPNMVFLVADGTDKVKYVSDFDEDFLKEAAILAMYHRRYEYSEDVRIKRKGYTNLTTPIRLGEPVRVTENGEPRGKDNNLDSIHRLIAQYQKLQDMKARYKNATDDEIRAMTLTLEIKLQDTMDLLKDEIFNDENFKGSLGIKLNVEGSKKISVALTTQYVTSLAKVAIQEAKEGDPRMLSYLLKLVELKGLINDKIANKIAGKVSLKAAGYNKYINKPFWFYSEKSKAYYRVREDIGTIVWSLIFNCTMIVGAEYKKYTNSNGNEWSAWDHISNEIKKNTKNLTIVTEGRESLILNNSHSENACDFVFLLNSLLGVFMGETMVRMNIGLSDNKDQGRYGLRLVKSAVDYNGRPNKYNQIYIKQVNSIRIDAVKGMRMIPLTNIGPEGMDAIVIRPNKRLTTIKARPVWDLTLVERKADGGKSLRNNKTQFKVPRKGGRGEGMVKVDALYGGAIQALRAFLGIYFGTPYKKDGYGGSVLGDVWDELVLLKKEGWLNLRRGVFIKAMGNQSANNSFVIYFDRPEFASKMVEALKIVVDGIDDQDYESEGSYRKVVEGIPKRFSCDEDRKRMLTGKDSIVALIDAGASPNDIIKALIEAFVDIETTGYDYRRYFFGWLAYNMQQLDLLAMSPLRENIPVTFLFDIVPEELASYEEKLQIITAGYYGSQDRYTLVDLKGNGYVQGRIEDSTVSLLYNPVSGMESSGLKFEWPIYLEALDNFVEEGKGGYELLVGAGRQVREAGGGKKVEKSLDGWTNGSVVGVNDQNDTIFVPERNFINMVGQTIPLEAYPNVSWTWRCKPTIPDDSSLGDYWSMMKDALWNQGEIVFHVKNGRGVVKTIGVMATKRIPSDINLWQGNVYPDREIYVDPIAWIERWIDADGATQTKWVTPYVPEEINLYELAKEEFLSSGEETEGLQLIAVKMANDNGQFVYDYGNANWTGYCTTYFGTMNFEEEISDLSRAYHQAIVKMFYKEVIDTDEITLDDEQEYNEIADQLACGAIDGDNKYGEINAQEWFVKAKAQDIHDSFREYIGHGMVVVKDDKGEVRAVLNRAYKFPEDSELLNAPEWTTIPGVEKTPVMVYYDPEYTNGWERDLWYDTAKSIVGKLPKGQFEVKIANSDELEKFMMADKPIGIVIMLGAIPDNLWGCYDPEKYDNTTEAEAETMLKDHSVIEYYMENGGILMSTGQYGGLRFMSYLEDSNGEFGLGSWAVSSANDGPGLTEIVPSQILVDADSEILNNTYNTVGLMSGNGLLGKYYSNGLYLSGTTYEDRVLAEYGVNGSYKDVAFKVGKGIYVHFHTTGMNVPAGAGSVNWSNLDEYTDNVIYILTGAKLLNDIYLAPNGTWLPNKYTSHFDYPYETFEKDVTINWSNLTQVNKNGENIGKFGTGTTVYAIDGEFKDLNGYDVEDYTTLSVDIGVEEDWTTTYGDLREYSSTELTNTSYYSSLTDPLEGASGYLFTYNAVTTPDYSQESETTENITVDIDDVWTAAIKAEIDDVYWDNNTVEIDTSSDWLTKPSMWYIKFNISDSSNVDKELWYVYIYKPRQVHWSEDILGYEVNNEIYYDESSSSWLDMKNFADGENSDDHRRFVELNLVEGEWIKIQTNILEDFNDLFVRNEKDITITKISFVHQNMNHYQSGFESKSTFAVDDFKIVAADGSDDYYIYQDLTDGRSTFRIYKALSNDYKVTIDGVERNNGETWVGDYATAGYDYAILYTQRYNISANYSIEEQEIIWDTLEITPAIELGPITEELVYQPMVLYYTGGPKLVRTTTLKDVYIDNFVLGSTQEYLKLGTGEKLLGTYDSLAMHLDTTTTMRIRKDISSNNVKARDVNQILMNLNITRMDTNGSIKIGVEDTLGNLYWKELGDEIYWAGMDEMQQRYFGPKSINSDILSDMTKSDGSLMVEGTLLKNLLIEVTNCEVFIDNVNIYGSKGTLISDGFDWLQFDDSYGSTNEYMVSSSAISDHWVLDSGSGTMEITTNTKNMTGSIAVIDMNNYNYLSAEVEGSGTFRLDMKKYRENGTYIGTTTVMSETLSGWGTVDEFVVKLPTPTGDEKYLAYPELIGPSELVVYSCVVKTGSVVETDTNVPAMADISKSYSYGFETETEELYWTNIGTDYQINEGKMMCVSTTTSKTSLMKEYAGYRGKYALSTSLELNSFSISNPVDVGLALRYLDDNNYTYITVSYNTSESKWEIKLSGKDNGTYYETSEGLDTSIVANKNYILQVITEKDHFVEVYFSGEKHGLEIPSNVNMPASGSVGLVSKYAETYYYDFNVVDRNDILSIDDAIIKNTSELNKILYIDFNSDEAIDKSGHRNNPTVINGVTTDIMGINSRGYYFDGASDYLQIPRDESLEPANGLTISVWIYPEPSTNAYGVIVDKACTSHISPYYTYEIRLDYDTTTDIPKSLKFFATIDGTLRTLGSTDFTGTYDWYHIVGTWDGTVARLYVNGELMSEQTYAGTISYYDTDLFIGKFRNLTSGDFKGRMDDLKIYDHAVTTEEIQNEYTMVKAMRSDLSDITPIMMLDFSMPNRNRDYKSVTTEPEYIAYDLSDNGHNGAIKGNAEYDYVEGAYYFDGVNSLVTPMESNTEGILDNHTEHTINTLVKRTSDTTMQVLFVEGGSGTGYGLYLSDGGATPKIVHCVRESSSIYDTVSYDLDNLELDTWYYITGVYSEKLEYLALYVNGVEVASKHTEISLASNPGNGWRIGGANGLTDPLSGTTSDIYLKGYLQECTVYDKALSETEIMGLIGLESNYIEPKSKVKLDGLETDDDWVFNAVLDISKDYKTDMTIWFDDCTNLNDWVNAQGDANVDNANNNYDYNENFEYDQSRDALLPFDWSAKTNWWNSGTGTTDRRAGIYRELTDVQEDDPWEIEAHINFNNYSGNNPYTFRGWIMMTLLNSNYEPMFRSYIGDGSASGGNNYLYVRAHYWDTSSSAWVSCGFDNGGVTAYDIDGSASNPWIVKNDNGTLKLYFPATRVNGLTVGQ